MENASMLDWLRYSVDEHMPNCDVLPPYELFGIVGPLKRMAPNYNMGLQLQAGTIQWNTKDPGQRKLITLTGADLFDIRAANISERSLLHFVTTLKNVKITRMDYALDIFETSAEANHAWEDYRQGKLRTRARTVHKVESHKQGDDQPAVTVYVGSRTSQAMVRIYDKGRQLGLPYNYVRAELELKGGKALAVAKAMVVHGIEKIGKASMRDQVDMVRAWWRDSFATTGRQHIKPEQRQADWNAWIAKVVLPNFEKAIIARLPEALDLLRTLAQAVEETREYPKPSD